MKNYNKLILFFLFLCIASPVFASADYDAGLKAYNKGHYSLAKSLFQNAIKINSKDVNARYMLSQIYVKEKNYSGAKIQYQYIMKIAPNSQAAAYSKQGLDYIAPFINNNSSVKTAVSSSGTKSSTAKSSDIYGSIKTDTVKTPNPTNQYLKFYYYIPTSLCNKKDYPIVFYIPGLHGEGKGLLHEEIQDFANKNGFAIASITFKFNEKDFNNSASYQYPQAWAGQAFKDIIAKIKSKNIPIKDVYLMGFSAGAQFSGRFALQNPGYLKGVALCGCGAKIVPDKTQSTKFFVGIGEKEDTFRKEAYDIFIEGAKKANLNVKSKIYPKLGHATSREEEADVNNFFVAIMKQNSNSQ